MRLCRALLLVAGMTATLHAREAPTAFTPLFNGKDHSGWEFVGCSAKHWPIKKGTLTTNGSERGAGQPGWLVSARQFDDFELRLEYLVQQQGTASAVAVRAGPAPGGARAVTVAIAGGKGGWLAGSVRPSAKAGKPIGQWNDLRIKAAGHKFTVTLNGTVIHDVDLDELAEQLPKHPGLLRPAGYVALQTRQGVARFRNVRIRPLGEQSNVGKVTLALEEGMLRLPFFTADSRYLITTATRAVRIWDVVTGELVRVVRLPGWRAWDRFDLSPDGKTLAAAGAYLEGGRNTPVIHLLSVPDGKLRHTLTGHRERILYLKFAGNGKLYSTAEDNSIRVWDPATGKQERVLRSGIHWEGVDAVRYHRPGLLAVSPGVSAWC